VVTGSTKITAEQRALLEKKFSIEAEQLVIGLEYQYGYQKIE